MKKHLALSLIFILTGLLQLSAAEVNIETARTVAKNVYYERTNLISTTTYKSLIISDEYVVQDNAHSLYYVFNIGNDQGFVIISADDAVYPVLAYSFKGSFDPSYQPSNISSWLKRYEDQIVYAIENNLTATEKAKKAWKDYSDVTSVKGRGSLTQVLPLVTAEWNQGGYYNDSCPADANGSDGHTLVGCVAVAMGQIMRYYSSPVQGAGSHSYYHPDYGTLSANFGATTYNWSSMPDDVNSPNASVAQLLYHCGVATEMNYGPYASGTQSVNAKSALVSYFGYASSTQIDYKQGYTEEKWNTMLRGELDASWPMYYAGVDLQNMSAHAFVCDGYQGTDHFHFNWGWGGWADGYFYTSDLSPGSSNFNGNQHIIKIRPTGTYDFCWGLTFLDSSSGDFNDGSGTHFYNNNSFCRWMIQPPGAVSITVNFSSFDTENGSDKVNIFDGDNMGAPLLGSFSGINLPSAVTSTTGKILIIFVSDAYVGGEGWEASYTSLTTGIDENNAGEAFEVFPNPGKDIFEIEFSNEATGDLNVILTDLTGKNIRSFRRYKDNTDFKSTLDLSGLSPGMYFLNLEMKDLRFTRYIIIE